MSRYELKQKALEIANKYAESNVDYQNYDGEENYESDSNNIIEYLSDYDRNHHNVIDMINKLHKNEKNYDELLDKYIMDLRTNGNADEFYEKEYKNFLHLFRSTKLIGDSMTFYIAVNRLLTYEYMSVLKGISVKEQYNMIENELNGGENNVILWNGYHIKYFNTANDYVAAYRRLIDKIHEKSPNAKVYICSLIPISKAAIDRDINSGFAYEIYKGPEFDAALRDNFKDEYININDFFTSNNMYFSDGVHPSSTAYRMIIPYLAFYINRDKKANGGSNDSSVLNQYYDSGLLNEKMIKDNVEETNFSSMLFKEYTNYLSTLRSIPGIRYYEENKEYVKSLYTDTCFVGDSNVLKLLRIRLIPGQNVVSFGAGKLEEMIEKIDDETRIDPKRFKNIVFWNGYNIKYLEDSNHIINEYNRLIEKIHKKNPNCKVYICSLLPATKQKIEEDLASGSPHNIYKGIEYDNALKNYYKDQYINTKVFIKNEDDYTNDGVHMQNDFYKRMIPYVGFYVNMMELKSTISSFKSGGGAANEKVDDITLFSLKDNKNDLEYNNKLSELKSNIRKNNNCNDFYEKNKEYILKLLDKTKIVGDSNPYQLSRFDVLDPKYTGYMRGKSLSEQVDLVSEVLDGDEKNIVLWNGYNIKYYEDSREYLDDYENLIDKISSINKNCKIYVCSLLPAKKSKIEEDLKSDFVHNIYRGSEFDAALHKHFGIRYIDCKDFLYTEDFYQQDGVHLNSTYMKMLVSYVAFYINNDIVGVEYGIQ